MNKLIPFLMLLLAVQTGCYNTNEPRTQVLKIYNWADYIGDGV